MIEVEHLSKIYGTTQAIADVTFRVEPGEILGFLGPNGAGKTTTMRILAGYLPATQGTARVAGFEVHENSMAVRQRIGYLPEHPPLYPDMTVEAFLYFVARIKRVPAGDRAEKVRSAMQRCFLAEKAQVSIHKLSKGFRQRVGIAQAIVHDPPAIILDEPTVGLDPRQIIEVRKLIESMAGDRTVILSTHILPEASTLCNRIAILHQGRIVATDTPEQLQQRLVSGAGYEVELEGTPANAEQAITTVRSLPGIQTVELATNATLPPNRYLLQVTATAQAEPAPEIAASLIAKGMRLHELRRTRVSLEDVFLTLTTADPQPEALRAELEGDESNSCQ
ncbi:MAG: ABC transporter ATP-binding protein [Coleofasciculaceae cyanobacterium SM2_3_26]|nr:ABC transporter ATP-binding protein [Coleofasciculaceae cyanobacterium SM2_3_26]